jgi:hypothetical protein
MVTVSNEIVETYGRYRWRVEFFPASPDLRNVQNSGISFQKYDEAHEDLEEFLTLRREPDGTVVRSKADIDRLLAAAIRGRSGCADFAFAGVRWQAPDDVGCNWCFDSFSYEVVGCLGGVLAEIDALRCMYRIQADEKSRLAQLH